MTAKRAVHRHETDIGSSGMTEKSISLSKMERRPRRLYRRRIQGMSSRSRGGSLVKSNDKPFAGGQVAAVKGYFILPWRSPRIDARQGGLHTFVGYWPAKTAARRHIFRMSGVGVISLSIKRFTSSAPWATLRSSRKHGFSLHLLLPSFKPPLPGRHSKCYLLKSGSLT
jgi:hypothetical protein